MRTDGTRRAGAPELNRVLQASLLALEAHVPGPVERALAFFLFGALQQFFFDGNKRSARLMMNGVLMSAGIDAISIPAARAQEFNERMVQFYLTREASGMMAFLLDLHPEGAGRRGRQDPESVTRNPREWPQPRP